MQLINDSFTKRTLVVGLIAGSALLASSAFAMPVAAHAGKSGCDVQLEQHNHAK